MTEAASRPTSAPETRTPERADEDPVRDDGAPPAAPDREARRQRPELGGERLARLARLADQADRVDQEGRVEVAPAGAAIGASTKRSYTEAEVEKGLQVLALCNGNRRLAAKQLEDDGAPIPADTLRYWMENRPDDYDRIKARVLPAMQEMIAEGTEAIALKLIDLEAKAIEQLDDKIAELKPAEAAGALRNISTSKGINVDKAQLLRGRPTSIPVALDAESLLRGLQIDDSLSPRRFDAEGSAEDDDDSPPPELPAAA